MNVKNKVILKLVLMGSRIMVVAFVGFVKTESTNFDLMKTFIFEKDCFPK